MSDNYRVYICGEHPNKKRMFFDAKFSTRQKARIFCRNRIGMGSLVIVHPDGREEWFN